MGEAFVMLGIWGTLSKPKEFRRVTHKAGTLASAQGTQGRFHFLESEGVVKSVGQGGKMWVSHLR
jgi:hypothetical protein